VSVLSVALQIRINSSNWNSSSCGTVSYARCVLRRCLLTGSNMLCYSKLTHLPVSKSIPVKQNLVYI
jgi:hypothetical protein